MFRLPFRLISLLTTRPVLMLASLCLLAANGCSDANQVRPDTAEKPRFPGVELTVGSLGEPAILTGLSAQRGEWEASRGGKIEIRNEVVVNLGELDLLIFPGQEMGRLVDSQALESIPNQAVLPPPPPEGEPARTVRSEPAEESPVELFQYRDIAPAFREQVTKYGSDRMALPLGGSALVLIYRRDAFSRPANLDAARQAGVALQAPSTWAQLDALAAFFEGRDWSGDGAADHGIAAVLDQDAEGLGNATFLARAAALGQHRDQYSFLFDAESMAPRIDEPPFVEALRGVLAWKRMGPAGSNTFDGPAARAAFRTGKVALLIDRAEQFRAWSGGHPVGVAPLPGSERVFEPQRKQWETPSEPNAPSYLPHGGGWLVGIKRGLSGQRLDAALDLARYLASPDNANRLRSEASFSMVPVRRLSDGPRPAGPDFRTRRRFPSMVRCHQPDSHGRKGRPGAADPGCPTLPPGPRESACCRALGQRSTNSPARAVAGVDAAHRGRGDPAPALALSPQPQYAGDTSGTTPTRKMIGMMHAKGVDYLGPGRHPLPSGLFHVPSATPLLRASTSAPPSAAPDLAGGRASG